MIVSNIATTAILPVFCAVLIAASLLSRAAAASFSACSRSLISRLSLRSFRLPRSMSLKSQMAFRQEWHTSSSLWFTAPQTQYHKSFCSRKKFLALLPYSIRNCLTISPSSREVRASGLFSVSHAAPLVFQTELSANITSATATLKERVEASGSGMADLLPKSVSLVLLKSRYS